MAPFEGPSETERQAMHLWRVNDCFEVSVDVSGEVSFEASDGFSFGESFVGSTPG